MCNLYRITKSMDEIAHLFDAAAESGSNAGGEIFPGYPGLVVAGSPGPVLIRTMVWGFPLARTGAKGQPLKPKPINNTRADKLGADFWRPSFRARRCLIPLGAFAEAEGPIGSKTRTWLSVSGAPVTAIAGVWRESVEWGACYSMVMTDACIDMGDIHDRMPVILAPEDRAAWLVGTPEEALALCRPFTGELHIERTSEPWAGSVQPRLPL